jgi:hypothetical protein
MGTLTEEDLDRLVGSGCTACGARRLHFRMYVDGLVPLQGGEPVGPVKWAYDGEKFLDGVYEVTCSGCERTLFTDSVCPRCHADAGLAKALASENTYPVPTTCPSCSGDEVRYIAMIAARTTYEGKRADKARTTIELADPGFHGYRVDCRDCGTVAELIDRCAMCAAPGPLRERP